MAQSTLPGAGSQIRKGAIRRREGHRRRAGRIRRSIDLIPATRGETGRRTSAHPEKQKTVFVKAGAESMGTSKEAITDGGKNRESEMTGETAISHRSDEGVRPVQVDYEGKAGGEKVVFGTHVGEEIVEWGGKKRDLKSI